MAKAKVKQRKDDKGRVLQKGESQRKLDGMYIYTYVDPYGKRCYAYSKDLFTLREKEQELMRAQMDGLDYYVGGMTFMALARKHGRSDCWVGRLLQKAEGVVDGMLMMLEIELEMDR